MPSKKEKNEDSKTKLPDPKFSILKLPLGETGQIQIFESLPDELKMDKSTFDEIWKMMPDEPSSVTCFGKQHFPKRRFKSYGESYHFSQENHEASKIENDFLKKILSWVQEDSGKPYNQILVNWYPDGSAGICAHADDETQLVKNSSIYSFSFGQERKFVVTNKRKKGEKASHKFTLPMKNNSLLVMSGDMQKHFLHEVTKESTKKCPGKRINITIRFFEK